MGQRPIEVRQAGLAFHTGEKQNGRVERFGPESLSSEHRRADTHEENLEERGSFQGAPGELPQARPTQSLHDAQQQQPSRVYREPGVPRDRLFRGRPWVPGAECIERFKKRLSCPRGTRIRAAQLYEKGPDSSREAPAYLSLDLRLRKYRIAQFRSKRAGHSSKHVSATKA